MIFVLKKKLYIILYIQPTIVKASEELEAIDEVIIGRVQFTKMNNVNHT